jgi:FkbM family methyltransferase
LQVIDHIRRWREVKARRAAIGLLNARAELVEVEWRPPIDSPLRWGDSTVRLPMDGIIGPRTLAHGHWHDELAAVIRARLPRYGGHRHLLVDVGANIGLVTRQLLAPRPEAWAGAVCFEPEAGNLERLRWNVAPLPGVRVEPFAVSDGSGTVTLHVDTGNAGDCSLLELPSGPRRKGVETQTVQMISGQDAWERIRALQQADHRLVWKSDTQGHDLTIVASMPAAMWDLVDIAMVEVRAVDVAPNVIARFMQVAAGFTSLQAVKRWERPISLEELERFCRAKSGSEFDLLMCR